MPHGFFTLEQWVRQTPKAKPQWVSICHVNSDQTLSDAIRRLEDLKRPGFYRITQTQRMIWAEKEGGKLRLRKWHVGAPEELSRSADAFERDGGKWPISRVKKKSAKKGELNGHDGHRGRNS